MQTNKQKQSNKKKPLVLNLCDLEYTVKPKDMQ